MQLKLIAFTALLTAVQTAVAFPKVTPQEFRRVVRDAARQKPDIRDGQVGRVVKFDPVPSFSVQLIIRPCEVSIRGRCFTTCYASTISYALRTLSYAFYTLSYSGTSRAFHATNPRDTFSCPLPLYPGTALPSPFADTRSTTGPNQTASAFSAFAPQNGAFPL